MTVNIQEYNYGSSMFIGVSGEGVPSPVFFDPHTSVFNDKPGATVITGAPGSGKTFLALTLTAMSAILGKTTVVLDPKGDFLSLINLQRDIGKVNVWNLDKGSAGLLDPFYMSEDKDEQMNLAVSVIDIFTNGLSDEQLGVLTPIILDELNKDYPSLYAVVDGLKSSENAIARSLGQNLDFLRKSKFAKLCFAPSSKKRTPVSINQGLTVITLLGLNLPGPNGPETRPELLATGILYLLTDFIRRILKDDESPNPKTVVIDEAHAIVTTRVGARCIGEMALLGRSRGLALLLITQNNSHLNSLDIENTISTRFAFRSDRKEAASIIKHMELPDDEDFEGTIINLERGECLMKDMNNRYSTVQISSWKQDWREAFRNNPLDRMKKQREQQTAETKKA